MNVIVTIHLINNNHTTLDLDRIHLPKYLQCPMYDFMAKCGQLAYLHDDNLEVEPVDSGHHNSDKYITRKYNNGLFFYVAVANECKPSPRMLPRRFAIDSIEYKGQIYDNFKQVYKVINADVTKYLDEIA